MLEKMNPHYSMTNPASIYDEEALTALELAGRTAAKMDETVEAYNQLESETNTHLQSQDDKIKYHGDVTIPTEVNVEVQKQIANGTFDRQIDQSLGNLTERVDHMLGSMTEGTTTMDAEVIDLRLGADNVSYDNAGQSVRTQLARLMEHTKVPVVFTVGKYINASNGHVATYDRNGETDGYHATVDHISVHGATALHLLNFYDATAVSSGDKSGFAFYDKDKKYISGKTFFDVSVTYGGELPTFISVDMPEGACYVRFTIKTITPELVVFSFNENTAYMKNYVESIDEKHQKNHEELLNYLFVKPHMECYRWIQAGSGICKEFAIEDARKYYASDFINVSGAKEIRMLNLYDTYLASNDQSGWSFYDENYNFISGKTANAYVSETGVAYPDDVTTEIPVGACYIRFTAFREGGVDDVVYALSTTITELKVDVESLHDVTKLENPLDHVRYYAGMMSIFNTVGCIGDSLASGCSVYNTNSGVDLYEHSWGQYMARATGNKYYNFSKGGLRTDTWLSSNYATQCFDGEHLCTAYIIGLAQNDNNYVLKNNVDPVSYIGTIADIKTDYNNNADTFYGRYGKIIQKIKEVQPKAKIFVVTDPLDSVNANGFNDAIREIAEHFDNVYLMDMHRYSQKYFNSGVIASCKRGGHYGAMAYMEIAYLMMNYIDWIIRKNPDEFNQVEFIGTDYSY